MVELYTKAINTPGAIPNVQNAWDLVVQKKCSDAKKTAMKTYNDFMMSELSPKLPCDSDEIRKCHNAAFARLESCFVLETAGLSTNTVEECFIQLKVKVKHFIVYILLIVYKQIFMSCDWLRACQFIPNQFRNRLLTALS